MACPFLPNIPSKRLGVFISSAQREENGFQWIDIRRKLKEELEKCPYVVPFLIDEKGSELRSTQFFQYEVQQADVIVMMIKGEVRPGTQIEFITATKHKKPLLIYFLKDDSPSLGVAQLRNSIKNGDYCTYRDLDDFDNIAPIIRNDVMENLVRYYQYKHFLPAEMDTFDIDITEAVEATAALRHGAPTKASIALFSSSYGHIFDLLGIWQPVDTDSCQSPMHTLGLAAIDWLVNGTSMDCETEILNLAKSLDDLYDSTDWLLRRWDAIRSEQSGDLDSALVAEIEALELAKERNLPQWIISDILIDCRNFENAISGKWTIGSDFQKELTEQDTIVYLPVLDRYLTEIYDTLQKEELKYQTASPNTVFYGSSIGMAINNVENYLFSAMLYGSYKHMRIARDILAKIFYKYFEFTEQPSLLLHCIKLLVIAGDSEHFKTIVDYKWDDAYAEIAAHADEIWTITNAAAPVQKNAIKQAVITKLGLYLNDLKFEEAENFLEKFSAKVYWGNSEAFFDSILQNMCRLNNARVMRMLTGIIRDKRFHLGGKIASIILNIRLDDVDIDTQRMFCNALKENLSFIVKNGGTPQIIAVLAKQNPGVFSTLSDVPENGLTGIDEDFYAINMGAGSWNNVLSREIQTAREQFEVNREPGKYTGFFERPYALIKNVIRNHFESSMDDVMEQKFFPLCIEVLNSQAVAEIKGECIDCLCDVLAYTGLKNNIPQELVTAIDSIEVSKVGTILDGSKGAFSCRVLMAKIITETADKDDLLEWCVGYNKKETSERMDLAECIEQFIVRGLPLGQIDITILSIVMQCLEDEYYAVRVRACNCLVLLLDTKYKDLVRKKLCEAAIDPSHYVRSQILKLCKSKKELVAEVRSDLLGILKNDANYAIRLSCKSA